MRGINLFLYSCKQGFINLRKNRMFTLASIGTVSACLVLFGLFYFAIANFKHIINTAENSVGVSVFFVENASDKTIKLIGKAIKTRPEVDHMEFISAEKAWDKFVKENFADSPDLIESFEGDNPLKDSASYEVYLKSIDQQDTLVEYIKGISGVRDVKKSAEVAKSLSSISNLVSIASSSLILVLLLVSIFLIYSTIATGIAVRRPEIDIMRLIGASDFFIWEPFIVEGIVIGLIGSAIPVVILFLIYGRIIAYIESKFAVFTKSLSFLSAGEIFSVLLPVSFALGVGIGLIGSYISVRRKLTA